MRTAQLILSAGVKVASLGDIDKLNGRSRRSVGYIYRLQDSILYALPTWTAK